MATDSERADLVDRLHDELNYWRGGLDTERLVPLVEEAAAEIERLRARCEELEEKLAALDRLSVELGSLHARCEALERDRDYLSFIESHWMDALRSFGERVSEEHWKPTLREMVDAARAQEEK